MAVIYLVAGMAIGYVLRAAESPAPSAGSASIAAAPSTAQAAASNANPLTPDGMRQMADRRAAPLIEKLKNNPNDAVLLLQLGSIYHAAHQFEEAAAYYGQAVQADPMNAAARTKLAISLYREGDVDGAIVQLNRTLRDDPGDANALFNLGMIRWQGKQDGAGAIAAWQQLLDSNPQLSPDRKAEVQRLLAEVQTSLDKPKPQPRSGEQ
jgi:cytochrome c-type biogenesis protein CcmH/NrfG